MVPSDVFIEHAAECECMARFSRDPENKEVWRRMAVRCICPTAGPISPSSPEDKNASQARAHYPVLGSDQMVSY
jgi:hypothetical protein